jgi:GDP-L-fucose synthase
MQLFSTLSLSLLFSCSLAFDPRPREEPTMKSPWSGKRVTVTGGAGFLGQHLVRRLHRLGAEVYVPRQREYNLTTLDACLRCLLEHPSDMLFHAAAYYGGIGINVTEPARLYYTNLVMGANLMEAARLARVRKFVAIGTACSYPGYLEGHLKEEDLWAGPCHASVVNYGLTKKMMAVQAQAYKKQYGLDSIHLILTNLYGPGDSYNPDRSHVVAALVRKFVEAELSSAPAVEVWGSGSPVREFIYVEDCADAIVLAAEHYTDTAMPLNIGTGIGTSIRELAETIRTVSGYQGKITWNADKPDGAAKKVLDVTRMTEALGGWTAPTDLKSGLDKTIRWYRANKAQADAKW